MSKAFGITFAVALAVIAGLVWAGFANTKGNHLAPAGSIGKVRTIKAAEDLTFMAIDFKVKNDSDRDMVVRSIETSVVMPDGEVIPGSGVAEADVKNAFRSYPLLGDRYNAVLKERDTIPAHGEVDRMVGIRFGAPPEKIDGRKRLTLVLDDITGSTVQLTK
ncbi:MAG: hypothetical protein M3N93_12175 [Acidobacteriota bacterium]|nr:hypothetical protein [Acidobacteriota bacterium]